MENKQCHQKANESTTIRNEEKKEISLTTADLLAATEVPTAQRQTVEEGQIAALFFCPMWPKIFARAGMLFK